MSEKVQGKCTKEQYSSEEERTAVCGCKFRCLNYKWGKNMNYFWSRTEDCEEHREMVRKAVEEAEK